MAYIHVARTTETSISVALADLDTSYYGTTRRVLFRAWRDGVSIVSTESGTIPNGISTSSIFTLTGLSPDTSYDIQCVISNISGHSDVTLYEYDVRTDKREGYPPDRPGWIYMGDVGYDFFEVYWQDTDGADYYEVYVDGRYYDTTTLRYVVIDANPGTSYEVCVRACNEWGMSSSRCDTFRTPSLPGKWNWSYDIYSGGEFYDYSSDGRTVYLMPASEWNDFTSKINEVREYKGLSSYSFTTATRNTSESGIRTCINQAINAINDMLSSGSRMSTISSGSEVRASIFIDMRDKLNSIE